MVLAQVQWVQSIDKDHFHAMISLLVKFFQEFVLGLDLCTFVYYGTVVLDFSHNCFLWFCHRLPKGEIIRVIYFVIS